MYRTTVKIEGMMCGMCEAHINDAVRKAFPSASKVKSSRKKKRTEFLTENKVDAEDVRRVIEAAGYDFISAECSRTEKKRGIFSLPG